MGYKIDFTYHDNGSVSCSSQSRGYKIITVNVQIEEIDR